MPIVSVTNFRKDLSRTIESVVRNNDTVTITTRSGNAVLISETDYKVLTETVSLMSNNSFMEGYKEAKEQDRSTYEELDWGEE